jgi:hypothetical protein
LPHFRTNRARVLFASFIFMTGRFRRLISPVGILVMIRRAEIEDGLVQLPGFAPV